MNFWQVKILDVYKRQATGKLIGRVGIENREACDGEPELGYMIDVSYQRKGYATEVCLAAVSYTHLRDLRWIMSQISRNFCQIRVLLMSTAVIFHLRGMSFSLSLIHI